MMRVVKHWHRLPREMADAHPWKHSRSGWMGQPGLVEDIPAYCRGLGLDGL